MTEMATQHTLEALTRALDMFCYERCLGLSKLDELLTNRQLSPQDQQWLETFSKLWQLTLALANLKDGTV